MRVPYPHVERPVAVPRPALVLTLRPVGPDGLLIWTAMITNALREDWPGDVSIPNSEGLGLIIPSKVRTAKVSALETKDARRIGRLDANTWEQAFDRIRANLGL